jgi:hypothetical protein
MIAIRQEQTVAEKEKLIESIIEMELEMFLSVPADGMYSCQQNPEGFRLHRRAQFSIWSADPLQSYHNDLRQAVEDGLNLMTIKYARMGGLIAGPNSNSLVEEIMPIQIKWQQEMIEKYPHFMAGARHLSGSAGLAFDISFETYLRSELETYSDNTLELLRRDLEEYLKAGINGSERIYEYLVKELGYSSIRETDQAQK